MKKVCRADADQYEKAEAGSLGRVFGRHFSRYRTVYPWKSTLPGTQDMTSDPIGMRHIVARANEIEATLESYASEGDGEWEYGKWITGYALHWYGYRAKQEARRQSPVSPVCYCDLMSG